MLLFTTSGLRNKKNGERKSNAETEKDHNNLTVKKTYKGETMLTDKKRKVDQNSTLSVKRTKKGEEKSNAKTKKDQHNFTVKRVKETEPKTSAKRTKKLL